MKNPFGLACCLFPSRGSGGLFLPINIYIIVCGYIKTNPVPERIIDCMGDSGEGLVDANARIQERMDEIQDSRRKDKGEELRLDPERLRARESLRLAKTDLERQLSATMHESRRLYLLNALAEVDRRLRDLQASES
jgi:hypothetical protein